MMPKGGKIEYHSNIKFTPETNSVLVIDESDEHVFEDPACSMKFSKKCKCICLTATCAESKDNGLER